MSTNKIKFEESSLPNNLLAPLNAAGQEINPATDSKLLFESTFTSIAKYLSFSKNKEKKAGLVIKDIKGNFILGGIVEYFPNEEDPENNPGNWSFEYSFYEEDFQGIDPVLSTDPTYQRVFGDHLFEISNLKFYDSNYIILVVESCAKCLKEWLELNAKEGEVTELELDGIFLATTTVENGEKVYSLTPHGELKKKIKNDESIEVAI